MRPNRFCTAIILAQGFLFSSLPFPGMAAIAHAADGLAPAVAESAPSPAKTIDTLFASLKKERNAVKARSIANQIASEWNDSGSATINLLMQWAGEAADEKRNAAAYDFLDQIVLLDPDYVQAPYRRAMVHFADGDTRKAMADINLTLEREPRYFPALASLANILEASGRDELALKAWERYLALYPADKDARKEAADLSEKLAGTRG
ncbi:MULTISPECIES: tetratricopeptide repeat protein [Agrobacterium]|jgi:tetratricopeptide (TPR) repeat protein|nr:MULTISPECIES: tetratricopeptide repeat protein [Agrobacterium]QNP81900.1 hypothetical protein IAI05_18225 [Agrobacterium tumefaciens]TCV53891.1 hypothetical protein EDB97_102191 [Agrobacterium tumefaciens]WHO24024.1 hypothetical protein G6L90_20530 [Agrobacterium tumefaciens]CUX43742.1 Conserved hypothetical protein [Agrobacterium tumefaciens str. CFBP 5621]